MDALNGKRKAANALTAPLTDGSSKGRSSADDILEIMPLGAGNEVGRSCILLKFKGKTIMFDCGIHPANSGLSALPYFDLIDPAEIDLLLVSHFHLDHCAALPYFLEKTTFKGRVFMTHPTKAIYKMLLTDYVKVSNIAIEDMLYDEQDLLNTMEKIEPINYHQEIDVSGVKFWCYNAGHVLGAAMFMVEIAGVRILYTGDFSRQEDRHLMAAEIPDIAPDILIVESTYGVQIHEPRQEREKRFTSIVHDTVKRDGRCLIPVFALGRAQELLLILDEFWESHPDLWNVPIYYASNLAKKCMTVYQTYINMMNDKIRQQIAVSNPFIFKHISNLKGMEHFQDIGPCVVMASPGMLQSGLSRELFELWCSDRRNGVIIPGYCVEGTLAKTIMSEPDEITTSSGMVVPLRMSVNYISFSAHSDFLQTSEFIDALQPPYVILVHGEVNEMGRLKQSLIQKYENKNVQVYSPKNGQTVNLEFKAEKVAKAVGKIASETPKEGNKLSGVVVVKDFNYHVMDPSDLDTYTQLSTSLVNQRIFVPYQQAFQTVARALEEMYESVEFGSISEKKASNSTAEEKPRLRVCNCVDVIRNSANDLILEWPSDPVNDMIADSIVAVILQTELHPTPPPAKKNTIPPEFFSEFLQKDFGDDQVRYDSESNTIILSDSSVCKISCEEFPKVIECADPQLKIKVEELLGKMGSALQPISSKVSDVQKPVVKVEKRE